MNIVHLFIYCIYILEKYNIIFYNLSDWSLNRLHSLWILCIFSHIVFIYYISLTANLIIIDVCYQLSTVFSTSLLLENRWNHDNRRQLLWDWQYSLTDQSLEFVSSLWVFCAHWPLRVESGLFFIVFLDKIKHLWLFESLRITLYTVGESCSILAFAWVVAAAEWILIWAQLHAFERVAHTTRCTRPMEVDAGRNRHAADKQHTFTCAWARNSMICSNFTIHDLILQGYGMQAAKGMMMALRLCSI
jgi:hypothetical protein